MSDRSDIRTTRSWAVVIVAWLQGLLILAGGVLGFVFHWWEPGFYLLGVAIFLEINAGP